MKLIDNSMKSKEDWHKNARFWEKTIKTLTKRKGYPNDWVDINNRQFQFIDLTPYEFPEDYKGLAVYERKSQFLSRGIRILVDLDENGNGNSRFWVENETEYLDILPPHTLTIICKLDKSNYDYIILMLNKWIDYNGTIDNLLT